MTLVRRVLHPTDLSVAARAAWEEAQRLAGLFQAEVVLLHVVRPTPLGPETYLPPALVQELLDTTYREARTALEAMREAPRDPGLEVSARVEQGPVATRILEVARDENADLVVMGTHGRTGLGRVMLGSVADRVVRSAACPVVTVPAGADPAGGRPARLARLCYATDFSPLAQAAWPWALAVAEASGAEVDLVHVTPPPSPDFPAGLVGRMARLLHEQGQAEAEDFVRGCPLPEARVHVLIERGAPSEQVLAVARSRAADLIVMGTHGWSPLRRWMLGAVAHHVIQAAPCPVLTVGPRGQSEERSDAA